MYRRWRKTIQTKAFEVEAILETKFENGQPSFLVKWAGYDVSSSTWEPIDHLVNCQDLLIRFCEQQAAKSSSSKESPIPDSPLPDSVPPRDLLPSDSVPRDQSLSNSVARDSELSSEDSVPIPTPKPPILILSLVYMEPEWKFVVRINGTNSILFRSELKKDYLQEYARFLAEMIRAKFT